MICALPAPAASAQALPPIGPPRSSAGPQACPSRSWVAIQVPPSVRVLCSRPRSSVSVPVVSLASPSTSRQRPPSPSAHHSRHRAWCPVTSIRSTPASSNGSVSIVIPMVSVPHPISISIAAVMRACVSSAPLSIAAWTSARRSASSRRIRSLRVPLVIVVVLFVVLAALAASLRRTSAAARSASFRVTPCPSSAPSFGSPTSPSAPHAVPRSTQSSPRLAPRRAPSFGSPTSPSAPLADPRSMHSSPRPAPRRAPSFASPTFPSAPYFVPRSTQSPPPPAPLPTCRACLVRVPCAPSARVRSAALRRRRRARGVPSSHLRRRSSGVVPRHSVPLVGLRRSGHRPLLLPLALSIALSIARRSRRLDLPFLGLRRSGHRRLLLILRRPSRVALVAPTCPSSASVVRVTDVSFRPSRRPSLDALVASTCPSSGSVVRVTDVSF